MSNFTSEREKRRLMILEGISQGLRPSEIAAQLGVNRWVIMNDLRLMRYNGDPELRQVERAQERIRVEKKGSVARVRDDRFLRMTGMTFQEKSFRNMIDFYKPELMRILRSENQYAAILNLPKSVQRTLKNNGIVANGRLKREITPHARMYLPSHET